MGVGRDQSLSRKEIQSSLWPTTIQGEGRAFQWGFFIANDVEPPQTTVFQHRVVLPPEKRDPKISAEADARLQPKLDVLEGHLSANKYFGIDRWDLADFMVASVTFGLAGMKYDMAKYPKLGAWLSESLERSGAKEAMKYRA